MRDSGDRQMWFVRVRDHDGPPIALRPTVAQLLRALWADHGNEVVAVTLIERVWGDEPPGDPVGSLHQTVARLRRTLPDGAVIRTAEGYRLVLPDGVTIEERTASAAGPDAAAAIAQGDSTQRVAAPNRRPFVGRDELVADAVEAAIAGIGTVFHGIAGNGKTRMVEEIVAALARQGCATAMLHCRVAGPTMPLGAVAPLLPDVIPQQGVSMVVAAREAIVGRLGGAQLFLGLDDLHLLDASSAALVSQLVTAGDAVLVGSHRNMAFVHEPIAMLWHEDFCRHMHVPALDRAATRQLITTVRAHADEHFVDEVWSLTLGNPLFVTTVLEHDEITTAASDEAVERLVGEQLAGLPAELRDALTVIALAEPVGADTVERLSDASALVALERRLLIRPERNGRRIDIRMRHPLYGAHLRSSASQLLVRGILNQLVDRLVDVGARRTDDLARLAGWVSTLGRTLPTEIAIRVAGHALAHGDAVTAERLARTAWETTGSVEAALVACEARYAWGEPQAALELVEAMTNITDAGAAQQFTEIAHRTVLWKQGGTGAAPLDELDPVGVVLARVARADMDGAEAAARAVIDAQPPRRADEVAVATATLGWIIGWRGRPVEGSLLAARAARSLVDSGHRPLAKWAWTCAGDAAVAGRALGIVDEAVGAFASLTVPTTLDGWVDIVIAGRHRLRHEHAEARSLLRAVADRSRASGRWFDEAMALHDLVRSGGGTAEVIDRLARLAAGDRELIALLAEHAAALHDDQDAGLAAIAERLAAASLMGYASDALARAAELAAAGGARQRARDLRARWAQVTEECDAPIADSPILAVDPLTAREREIAMFAADGHSSRVVAERLGLSVRTVDNHLAHVFTKLGVSSRSELRDALDR